MEFFGIAIKQIAKDVKKNLSIKARAQSKRSLSEATAREGKPRSPMLSDYLKNSLETLKVR